MSFWARDLLVRQRTQTINALRGHLAEFGIIAPKGAVQCDRLRRALEDTSTALPPEVVEIASMLLAQIEVLQEKITALEIRIRRRVPKDERAAWLTTIPARGDLCGGHRLIRTAYGRLPKGKRLRGLAGFGAPPAFHRRQEHPGPNVEDGAA